MRRRRTRSIGLGGIVLLGAVAFACRDAAEPFRPEDREPSPDDSYYRLTYGAADDRLPVWSADGDSVYYTTSSYEGNPLAPATILAIDAEGMGSIVPLLHNVQEGRTLGSMVTAPAIRGGSVAYIRVPPLLPESPCFATRVCPMTSLMPMVRLTDAALHARALDATHGPDDDIILPLAFAGHSIEADAGAPTGSITVSEYHPFQWQFEAERRAFFRPSWDPDGTRLVVSDGLRLLRWTLGANAAQPIPGTDDGMMPAWSSDGEWIAYARYARTSSITFTCEYQTTYMVDTIPVTVTDCVERRTVHFTADPMIVLTRPDGSGQQVLGQGTDPAWSPDGLYVYASARVEGTPMIVRMPLDGGPVTIVPRTEGGIEPAVSPDGRRLAFARSVAPGDPGASHDVWVLELQ